MQLGFVAACHFICREFPADLALRRRPLRCASCPRGHGKHYRTFIRLCALLTASLVAVCALQSYFAPADAQLTTLSADVTYPNPSNTSLLQCTACGRLLDVYTTLTFPVLLVDTLLFKPRVYRHLLTNRGGGSRLQREQERRERSWKLGAVVIGLDACEFLCPRAGRCPADRFRADIRCAQVGVPDSLDPFSMYGRALRFCLLGECRPGAFDRWIA